MTVLFLGKINHRIYNSGVSQRKKIQLISQSKGVLTTHKSPPSVHVPVYTIMFP